MIWVAVDAMGGDDAPRHLVDGALDAMRASRSRRRARRPGRADRRGTARVMPASIGSRVRLLDAPDVVTMEESPSAALRRKPGASIRSRRRRRRARRSRGALQRRAHRSHRDGGACRVRHVAGRGSAGAGGDDSDAGAVPPCCSTSVPASSAGRSTSCNSPSWAASTRRVALGIDAPRIGLLSIGEEATKGNELTRESHRLLKASMPSFIGNVEARDVYRGQADVIVCDGFTGNVALKISEGLVEVIEGLLRNELSVVTGLRRARRRAASRRQRRRDCRPRPIQRQGCAQRGAHGAPLRGRFRHPADRRQNRGIRGASPVIAFIFPGQGSQKVGMGRALADAYPICRETFEEADAALGEPLSRIIFDGPEDQLTLTENTQPAILAVSTAAARLLASRGLAPSFVAGHSLGEYSANVAAGTFAFADALRLVRRRGRYMQEAVPVGEGAMAAILGLDARPGRAGVRRGGRRRGRQPGEPERRRTGGDRRRARRRRARRRARQGARREARDPAAGERAVPLRADEAGRGSARAGAARDRGADAARADRRQRRRRAETRRGRGDRGARAAGVVAGPMGGGRQAPCVGRRHNVC